MCDNILSSNWFLIPSDSVTATLMEYLEKTGREAETQLQDSSFLTRIKAVVNYYLFIPAAALVLFPVTACVDLIGRIVHVVVLLCSAYRKVYLVGLISLIITLPLRIGGYLLGYKDFLFPVDYKFKSNRYKVHPILEMLKFDKAAQEKFDRLSPFEDEIRSNMSALEEVLFDLAFVPGGIEFIQSEDVWFWPTNKDLEIEDFRPVVDFLISLDRVDVLIDMYEIVADEKIRQILSSAIAQGVVRAHRRELITTDMPDDLLHSIAQEQLEEEIEISEDTIEKIQRLMPRILARGVDPELTWHTNGHNKVFSLTSVPNLIFKMAPSAEELEEAYEDRRNRERQARQQPGQFVPLLSLGVTKLLGRVRIFPSSEEQSEKRFQNMIEAQKVCLTHQFNLLVVPHAKKFEVDGETLIAEERINISTDRRMQKKLYRSSPLDETIRELAKFILETGFNDVDWRNVPIIKEEPEFQGRPRIALVDLEHMGSSVGGIFGDSSTGSRGLIKCLFSEKQIDVVLNEARKGGVVSKDGTKAKEFKANRMEKIRWNQQLKEFYLKRGILKNPRRPVEVKPKDFTNLVQTVLPGNQHSILDEGLSKVVQTKTIIDLINKGIQEAPENLPTKNKRKIKLELAVQQSTSFFLTGLAPQNPRLVETEQIIKCLVTQGHLFSVKQKGNHFVVQA